MKKNKSKTQETFYATYFDSGYLSRGLILIDSLREQGDFSHIWILCLDAATKDFLDKSSLREVTAIALGEFEKSHPELIALKEQRSKAEFYFSVGPTFIHDVLIKFVPIDSILAYLDADLFFFNNPKIVFEEMGNSSVGIIEHRYPSKVAKKLNKYGKFNVGWVGFRNSEDGISVLEWWAQQCINWCFDKPIDGKYADQGYLDTFPSFDGVKILQNSGLNVAPWNSSKGSIRIEGDEVFAIDKPLVFFHFHGIQETKERYVTSQLIYRNSADLEITKLVYVPYLKKLAAKERELQTNLILTPHKPNNRGNSFRGILFRLKKKIIYLLSISTGNTIPKSQI